MTLTKERKALMAVLGLGLIAVAANRLVIGSEATSPSVAVASPIPDLSPGVLPPLEVVTTGPPVESVSTNEPTLSDRLEEVVREQGLGLWDAADAFRPSTDWLADGQSQAGPHRRQLSPADAFKQKHLLEAVMATGGGGRAVVDGRTLRIGQHLDGFELISVNQRSAVFESNGTRVKLTLSLDLASR